MEKLTINQILERLPACFEAASKATNRYLDANPNSWYPCGFAWVNVKNGRSRLARALKDNYKAYKSYSETGVQLWNPSNSGTQAMYAKIAGCVDFISELVNQGLVDSSDDVTYSYRMD